MEKLKNKYRYSMILLKQLVRTDFKLRYQGSVLGYVWTLLRPLALFIILYIVFAKFLRVGEAVPHYPVYLLLGIVFWNYFIEVTTGSVQSIVSRGEIIRKISFPKYVIPLSGSFSALINLGINFVILGTFMAFSGANPSIEAVFVIPLLLAELFIFSLAMAFLLSALFVKYRDIQYIWEVIAQGAFYATPILYPLSLVPALAAKLLLLNPLAQILHDARQVLITPETTTLAEIYTNNLAVLIPQMIVLGTLTLSVYYFKKQSRYFAEEV